MNDFTQRLIAILLVVPILVGIFRGTNGMGIAAGAIVVALFFANLDKFSRFEGGGNRRLGITSTCHLSRKANQPTCKSDNLSR